MKYRFFLSVFLVLFSVATSAEETKKYLEISKNLFLVNTEAWSDYVSLVKSDKEIPPYLQYTKPSAYEKRILTRYNIAQYNTRLVKHLNDLLSLAEIQSTNKTLANPFIIKFIKTLNYNHFQEKKIYNLKGEIHPKLKPLIISVYNLFGYAPLMKLRFNNYKQKFKEIHETSEILSRSKDIIKDHNMVKLFSINDYREKYYLYIYQRVKELSISELREFIRLVRNDKAFLKYNQVMTAYHFSILFDLQTADERIQDQKKKLGLDA